MSFSSYAEWVEMAYDPEDNIWYVERDSVIEKDGYIYWTEMVNWIKPISGYKSTQGERQGDCENNRSKTLSITHFKLEMGNGETEVNTKDNSKWQNESSGSVAEIILNNLCEYVESLRPKAEEKPSTKDGVYQCKVLAESLLWDDKPHMTKGETKEFLFEKTSKTVKFQEDSPFYGATLNVIKEEDSSFGARFEASSENSKLMYFYPDERNIYGDEGRFKYAFLGVDSGIMGMFEMILATCNPIEFY